MIVQFVAASPDAAAVIRLRGLTELQEWPNGALPNTGDSIGITDETSGAVLRVLERCWICRAVPEQSTTQIVLHLIVGVVPGGEAKPRPA